MIPSRARIPAYPVVEKWGLVWTSIADEPFGTVPELPEHEGLTLTFMCAEPIPQQCGVCAATENFRDVAHFPFVHAESMGDIARMVESLEVRREDFETWMRRKYVAHAGEGAAIWSNDDGDVHMNYHTIAPSFSSILYEYDMLGIRVLLNATQPRTRDTCTIYFVVGVDAGFTGPPLEEVLALETVVFTEDRPYLDRLDLPEIPWTGGVEEFSCAADRYTLGYRRAFLDWVRAATQ